VIRLQGKIDESWLAWFGAVDATTIKIETEPYETTLSSIVTEVGLIRQLHGLGVILLAVECEVLISDRH
jgi:hypothetical protein